MRIAYNSNSELYGPLQKEYLKGWKAGTDVWIHKNRFVQNFYIYMHKTYFLIACVA